MSLRSSEIHNCSWRISTVLEYVLISSSSCQAYFPLTVRPMRRVWELILKVFFDSPEMNCSIFFSMHMLWMTKKIHHFLRYFKIGEWIFPWFNISPSPLPNRNYSWRRAGRSSSWWFCFGLWSACKIFRIQFKRILFELKFWNFCLIVVQIHHKLIWSMRNSDPGMSIVSVQRPNSDLNSTLTMQATGRDFQNGSNLCVSLDPSSRLWWSILPWKSVFTTGHWMKLWKICSVFRPEVLSNFNNIQKSCIQQNLLNLSCCHSFSIRPPKCCNRRSWLTGSSQSKGTSVFIILSTNEELDCSLTTGLPVLSWRDSYSSHFSATAP